MKILVVMNVEEEHKAMLSAAAPEAEILYIPGGQVDQETAARSDIIVGNIPVKLVNGCKNLKLLQLNSAGANNYTGDGILPEGALLANATGAYGLAISEHMIGALLCIMKKLDRYKMNQTEKNWHDEGSVTSIYGAKTLIVGYGNIGSEFAKRMHAMGSTVSAIRRNKSEKPDFLDSLYQMDHLYESLEEADIVAACLPDTPETRKLFNEEAFSHMKKGAYFLNVGRGNSVDSDALYEALCSGKLAGASVDVTDPEPLPADHKLWDAPNILITPHISGGYHLKQTHDTIIRIACDNIRHYQNGEPFENIVDMKTGYRKNV
ncbi:MAG: D-2-hydroxyacid dehydrogenase [Lachnospiraceae bacterium]|nr:D-2-hydroxyacid dehydrogenase [Lachnospiraceae bacterium]